MSKKKFKFKCPLCGWKQEYELAPPYSGFCEACEALLYSFSSAQQRVIRALLKRIVSLEARRTRD